MRYRVESNREQHQVEVDNNFDFFRKKLPELLQKEHGRYALIRHREIAGIFDTLIDAVTAGKKMFADRMFSIQQITEASIDLGFFSHAVHLG
jgi:hypothetical protein